MEAWRKLINKIASWLILLECFIVYANIAHAESDSSIPIISCHKKFSFDETTKKLFVPSSLPLKLFLATPENEHEQFSLEKTFDNQDQSLLLPEGEHKIRVNATEAKEYTILSDATSPKTYFEFSPVALFQKSAELFYGKGLQLSLNPVDSLSGIESLYISLNGEPFKTSTEKIFSFSTDGKYNFLFYSCDKVGNNEQPTSTSFIVDVSAPQTELKMLGTTRKNFAGIDAEIALMSTDALSGIAGIFFSFDGGAEKRYETPISLDTLTPGPHVISYYAVDNVNNRETHHEFSFIYDAEAPELELDSSLAYQDGNLTYLSKFSKIQIKTADKLSNIDSILCKEDSAPNISCKEFFPVSAKPGLHVISVASSDFIGNTKLVETEVFLDDIPPSIKYEINGPYYINNNVINILLGTKISLSAIDTGSGIEKLEYCFDNEKCTRYDNEIVMNESGKFNLVINAVDRVKNAAHPVVLVLHVSASNVGLNTAQRIDQHKTWVTDNQFGVIGARGIPFRLQISDTPNFNGNVFTIKLPEKMINAWAKNDNSDELKLSLASFTATMHIPIDDQAPISTIQYSKANRHDNADKIIFGAGLEVSLQSAEPLTGTQSGTKDIFYNLNNRGVNLYHQPLQIFNIEQEYRLEYYSSDRVGNIENPQTRLFSIDLSPPKSTIAPQSPFLRNIFTKEGGLILQATDNLAGSKESYFSIDGAEFGKYDNASFLGNFTQLSEGKHNIKYYAIDNVGNQEPPNSFDFLLDTQTPILSYVISGMSNNLNDIFFVNLGAKIIVKALDQISGVEKISYKQDDSEEHIYHSPIAIANDNQTHQFELIAADRVGHKSIPVIVNARVDQQPPESNMVFNSPHYLFRNKLYLTPSSTIKLLANDSESGIKNIFYRVNSTDYLPYSESIQFPDAGDFEFSYFAVDMVGNKETPHVFNVIMDGIKPEINIELANKTTKGDIEVAPIGTLVQLLGADLFAGVKDIYYQINGGEKKIYRQPFRIMEKGLINLQVVIYDWVDNFQKIEKSFEIQ